MKATGIVRRIDDLGRIVIPKEIRRTLKIREGDPSYTTLAPIDRFCYGMLSLKKEQVLPLIDILCVERYNELKTFRGTYYEKNDCNFMCDGAYIYIGCLYAKRNSVN